MLFRAILSLSVLTATVAAAELSTARDATQPKVMPASREGEEAIRSLRLPAGFKAELIAAEPNLANVVAFHIDERGRIYVCETFRLHAGVTDIRGHMDWLDEDLAARTPDDRYAMMQRHMGPDFAKMGESEDRIRVLFDRDGDRKIDEAKVFADGFNHPLDGIASGVLARNGEVFYANLPNLWLLKDNDGDGVADFRKSLSYGYGVRVGFLGHDLHGLAFGPDGRLYFSIGDRGTAVKIAGKTIGDADAGNVFRCNPDGSNLEVFAHGLRNPQELAFDDQGNLFTGDNNSDGGDQARWVYLVEGGDSGWRVGYQHLNTPTQRGVWNSEKLWHPQWEGQAAYIVPPITNITSGPSGLAYYPGTGLPAKYKGHFFLVDFRGGRGSGIHTFATRQKGATFEILDHEIFVGEGLPTDVDFGADGGIYFSDWVNGWGMTGKGRLYRVFEPASADAAIVQETKKLRAAGFAKADVSLLKHPDKRVRQEAQFALAAKGAASLKAFSNVARRGQSQVERLHGIWGLWQLGLAHVTGATEPLLPLLTDKDAEVRAQAAKVLGDLRAAEAFSGLTALLKDAEPRPRFFAAIALGRLGRAEAIPGLLNLARDNKDVYIRHAIVMGLAGAGDADALLEAAGDSSANARMAILLALRRLERAEVSRFLADNDPLLVVEAARAINDLPISGGMEALSRVALTESSSVDLSRRVANANLRYGTRESAARLAKIALQDNLQESTRAEALKHLANWERPSGRDEITGLWRPTAGPRDANHAREAMRPALSKLLASAPDAVRLAAAQAAGKLQMNEAADELARWIRGAAGSARMRVQALNSLSAISPDRLGDILPKALNDPAEEVRKEAITLSARVQVADPTRPLAAVLESGSIGEKQSALAALANLEGSEKVLESLLSKLENAPKEIRLDIIEAAAKRPALKEKAAKFDGLTYSLNGGDAAAGRKIFIERAEVSCQRCHKIRNEGGEVGPDLTGLGARLAREQILEAIAYPNKSIAAGFESVTVFLKNGTTVAGVVKSENDSTLVVNSPEDGILNVKKSEIEKRAPGISAMPEGLATLLTRKELRDLVEFLATQK